MLFSYISSYKPRDKLVRTFTIILKIKQKVPTLENLNYSCLEFFTIEVLKHTNIFHSTIQIK